MKDLELEQRYGLNVRIMIFEELCENRSIKICAILIMHNYLKKPNFEKILGYGFNQIKENCKRC